MGKADGLLDKGANCNTRCQAVFWCKLEMRWLRCYSETGDAVPDCTLNANTCLRICVFRISDCMLTERYERDLVEMAKILVSHGADCSAALKLFKQRYGDWEDSKPDDDSAIVQLYTVLTLANEQL